MTFLNCTVWNELSCTLCVLHKATLWHQLLMQSWCIQGHSASFPLASQHPALLILTHKNPVFWLRLGTKHQWHLAQKACASVWKRVVTFGFKRDASSGLLSKGCVWDSSIQPWSLPLLALSWLILCCVSFSGYLIQRVFKVYPFVTCMYGWDSRAQ